tara:strand:+ start:1676 stop:2752 length:1077 start_codon:yes stop_codon:yes gene_type:complete
LISLKELAVLLTFIFLLGCFADMVVINEEWEKLKKNLSSISFKIKQSPLNKLTFLLAIKIVQIFERTAHFKPRQNKLTEVSTPRISYFALRATRIFVFFIFPTLTIYVLINNTQHLLSFVLFVPLFTISLIWFLLILIYELTTERWNERGDFFWRAYSKSSLISAIITFVAIIVSSEIFNHYGYSEYWFNQQDVSEYGVIKHKEILGLINYPFDFLSLLFTYFCVKRIASKKKYYQLLPFLDVAFSLILSSLLYVVLFSIPDSNFGNPSLLFDFLHINNQGFEKLKFDMIYLSPIILSTFLPITLLAFIFLSLIFYKYLAIIFSRVFLVLSEKDGSIFKEIAFTISAMIGFVNALAAI